jgi:hypothetical protein
MGAPEMRKPGPRANAENRAEVIRNGFPFTIPNVETETNFAALYLRRRFGLSPCLAQAVAALANLGRAIG